MELRIVIEDPVLVSGVGPGGSGKEMQRVLLNGDHVGYVAFRAYPREGGVFEAYLPDATTMLTRNRAVEITALDLVGRRLRSSTARQRPASASA
jgi:hypothetical protein